MWRILFFLAVFLIIPNPSSAQRAFNSEDAAKNGWSSEQDRTSAWHLAQHKKLNSALAAIKPGKKGVVEAFILSIGLDSDPVFTKEASETLNVLSYRYKGAGHSLLLTAGSDDNKTGAPQGSPENLAIGLATIAERMNRDEDVLILFSTSHGNPKIGLAYKDGNKGMGMIAPQHLATMLDGLGVKRRMILISACYSGIFMPPLSNQNTVMVTAASSRRSSFGCSPGNDWTFFGDALINNALRKTQPFEKATQDAVSLIEQWETKSGLLSSEPQVFVGKNAKDWLTPLEAKMPKIATSPKGQPAISSIGPSSKEKP